jgi:cytochrome c oxidase assembly protein subunit 15
MRGPALSLRTFLRVARVALFSLVSIIITGSLVRLTGSGLGCVDWPACNEERFVDVSSGHAAIEQVNRLFTGVVAAAVIAAVLSALFVRPRVRSLIGLSVAEVVGVLAQVVVGGIVVLTGLNPWSNMAHFLISIALVTAGVLLIHETKWHLHSRRAGGADTSWRLLSAALVVAASTVMVLGTVVTGTGPHAGDENAIRLGFDLSAVVRLHSVAVWVFLTVLVIAALTIRRRQAIHLVRPVEVALAWTLAQGLVGYVQYFSGVPVLLVALHVAGSVFVWMAVVRLVAEMLRPIRSTI